MDTKVRLHEPEYAHVVNLSLKNFVEFDKFLEAIEIDSKVYERIYHDDYMYIETMDHEVYIFKVRRG